MMLLESPNLGASKEKWIAWLAQLRGMKRDPSIKLEIERTQRIIQEIEAYEVESGTHAFA